MYAYPELCAELTGLQHGTCMTMMDEIEATINPDTIILDGHVLLRINRPFTRLWNGLEKTSDKGKGRCWVLIYIYLVTHDPHSTPPRRVSGQECRIVPCSRLSRCIDQQVDCLEELFRMVS